MGESGNLSKPSEIDELGLGVVSCSTPFLNISTFFFTLPLLFSNLLVSIDAALRLTDFPGLASGLIIHQDDFPVPSFCTLMNLLWRDKLCRIEFWKKNLILVVGRFYFIWIFANKVLVYVCVCVCHWFPSKRMYRFENILGGTLNGLDSQISLADGAVIGFSPTCFFANNSQNN